MGNQRVAQSFLKITFVQVSALWAFTTLRALALTNQACMYAGQASVQVGMVMAQRLRFSAKPCKAKVSEHLLGLLREHVPTCWREMSARLQSPVGAGTTGITLFDRVRLHFLALLYDLGSRTVQD